MAWTVNIDEVINLKSGLIVRVTLSDGSQKVKPDEYHVTTEHELKVRLNADIDRLSQSAVDFPKIVPGPYDPKIDPPEPPPDPTPEEIAKADYAADLTFYRHMQRAVALTVKKNEDEDVVAQLTRIKNNFLSDYIDLF